MAHRDLKSLNILIRKGYCMISDFGLSKEDDGATATTTAGALGTPAWSAPEVRNTPALDQSKCARIQEVLRSKR